MNSERTGLFTRLIEKPTCYLKDSPERSEKLKQEADKAGLILVRYDKLNNDKRLYQFKSCGHYKYCDIANVRHSTVTCQLCITTRMLKVAENKNLVLIKRESTSKPSLYMVRSCRHLVNIYPSNLEKNDTPYECTVCWKTSKKDNKENFGLLLLEEAATIDSRLGTYLLPCGHKAVISNSSLAKNKFSKSCRECSKDKVIKLAEDLGLEFLHVSKSRPRSHMRFRFKECGHERDIDKICITRNNFICHICKKSFLKKPSNIYLFEIKASGKAFLKLGYGKNVNRRLLEYGVEKLESYSLLACVPIKTGELAMQVEHRMHNSLIDCRLAPEDMKNILKFTGWTECYPLEHKFQILKTIETIPKDIIIDNS